MPQVNNSSVEYGFLNECIKNQTPMTVILSNGYHVNGIITSEDNKALTIRVTEGVAVSERLIYKQVISTIQPFPDPVEMALSQSKNAKTASGPRKVKTEEFYQEPDSTSGAHVVATGTPPEQLFKMDTTNPADPFYVPPVTNISQS